MKQPSEVSEISDFVNEVPSRNGSKPRVLESIVSIVSPAARRAKKVLSSANNYWQTYAPVGLQLEVESALNTATSPVRAGARYVNCYLDNFASSRYLMYQTIGGIASVGTKFALSLSFFDDPGYVNQLHLVIAGAAGHTLIQWPAYVLLEHRKYGQSKKELNMEYWAWRSLEAFILNLPTYFIAAGQADLVGKVGGVTLGALSTSVIPGTPAKWFSNGLDTPVMHGVYRRLQIRKENGIPMSGREVYTSILKNGIITAGTIIRDGVYNLTIKPVNKYMIQPIKTMIK